VKDRFTESPQICAYYPFYTSEDGSQAHEKQVPLRELPF